MEQRQVERVQFFQLAHDDDLMPVWVFHRAQPDSILGLLLDISANGVQVLIDKSHPLAAWTYRLIIHADETSDTRFITTRVCRLWSKVDGTLYIRNGFAFVDAADLQPAIEQILAARGTGQRWLRCELAAA